MKCPEVVKNAVGETLQYLPEVPQKMHKKNVWKRVAVAATVLVIIGGGVLAVNPSLAANPSGDWKHLSAGRERGGLLW